MDSPLPKSMRTAAAIPELGSRCGRIDWRGPCIALTVVLGTLLSLPAAAIGTPAGLSVRNEVVVQFAVEGEPQPPVARQVDVLVDELLDVVVVNTDVGSVVVNESQTGAVQTYNVTNQGNGTEEFRLVPRTTLINDNFDTTFSALHLESNGVLGLQLGPGGDTLYVPGSNDPLLNPGGQQIVYVAADVPAGVPVGDTSLLSLDAVPLTIVTGSGTDDSAQANFPAVGTPFVGLGDPPLGTTNTAAAVTAVVGTSFDPGQPTFTDLHDFIIEDPVVEITKSVASVVDPEGGSPVIPGSVISYQILVEVAAGESASNILVVDPLPIEVGYSVGTLLVTGISGGNNIDDDFLPAGVDNTGFNSTNQAIEVDFGNLVGPQSLQIDFQAIVQ